MVSNSSKCTTTAIVRHVLQSRYSTKRFQPNKSIPNKILIDILQSSLTAPSGFNLQPWQIICVTDKDTKSILADQAMLGAGNQYRTKDAPVLTVFLADLELQKRVQRVVELERFSGVRDDMYSAFLPLTASFLTGEGKLATSLKRASADFLSPLQAMPDMEHIESWSYKNVGMIVQNYLIAATSHGLATCTMEGYDSRRVKRILKIPHRYGVPFMVATGYEYEEQNGVGDCEVKKTPRLGFDEMIFGNEFGTPYAHDNNDT